LPASKGRRQHLSIKCAVSRRITPDSRSRRRSGSNGQNCDGHLLAFHRVRNPSIPSFKDFRYPVGSPGYVRGYEPNVAAGTTDSAWLFAQLDRTGTVAAAAAVLTGVRGRAALAWIRTDRPDILFLARAALSPLAIAFDADGAVWWASNPAWLRRIGREHQLEMSEPHMVLEGTVMELRPAPSHVDMVATRRFVPAARPNDQYLTHAVWRGFSAQDLAADRSWLARSITSPDRRAHHPRVQRSGETNASSCSDRSFAESR